ncbi:MAG: VWA domain-containing protein [Acidobacteriia bacterium]|nr:VWA domain-containing protein [Terriglobia bacterium]
MARGAQSPAPPSQTGASRLVLAAATDPRNRPLVDLGPDDFVIEEGKDEREVLSVHPADYPIVVLLGTGVEAHADFATIQTAVLHFIERLGDERPIALVSFGGAPRLIASFEDDRKTVLARLQALSIDAAPGREVLRGAGLAAETLRATQTLFSAIVVVSGTPIDAARGTDEDTLGPIIESGAILHVVANFGNAAAAPGTLRGLVEQTHGVYTPVYTAASFQPALDRLADRLSTELIVEYLVPAGSKASDVRVGVRIPGARVRGLGVAPR